MKTIFDLLSPGKIKKRRGRHTRRLPSKWKVYSNRRQNTNIIQALDTPRNQLARFPFYLSILTILLPINYNFETAAEDPGNVNGPVYWLDANDLDGDGIAEGVAGEAGQSSGQVTSWVDKAGTASFTNTAGLSPGTSPDLVTDGINFNETIEFNKSVTSDYLARQITDFPDENVTVVLVIKSSGSGDGIVSYATSSNDNELLLLDQSNLELHVSNVSPGSTGVAVNQGEPVIIIMEYDEDQDLNLYINSAPYSGNPENIGSPLGNTGTLLFGQDQDTEGGIFDGAQAFQGQIGEVLIYEDIQNTSSIVRLESYLAIKFGITLDQTSGTDYRASSNVVIWDYSENTNYIHNIAALARDDASELAQEKSKSQHNDAIVTIARNSGANPGDGRYLIWSNNNGSTASTETINAEDLRIQKMTRQWRVQEKNFTNAGSNIGTPSEYGNVDISFDLTGITYAADEVRLLIDGDGDFGSGASISGALGTFNGDEVTFSNVDLDDGDYFSIGLSVAEGPGGVSANLNYWLDAQDLDADGIAEGVAGEAGQSAGQVTTWANKAGGPDFDINAGLVSGTTPDLKEDQINFNSAVAFNEATSSDYLGADVTDFPTSEITQFLVLQSIGTGDGVFAYATATNDNEFTVLRQENVEMYIDGTGGGSTGLNFANGEVGILAVDRTASNGQTNLFQNGKAYNGNPQTISSGNVLGATGTVILGQDQDELGGGFHTTQAYQGQLAEVVTYAKVLSVTQRQQVSSYLALKYGITLDQSIGMDYLASNGIVVWDHSESTTYANDIAGISRDDRSLFSQDKSKSAHSDAIVTIAKHSGGTPEDGEYFIWSNNGGATISTDTVDVGDQRVTKIKRQWRVQEKNFLDGGSGIGTPAEYGAVDISFDLSGITYTPDHVRLMIDGDGEFISGSYFDSSIGTFNGDVVTFSNVDLDDADYFSLALKTFDGPGGVGANLEFWIKADSGVVGSQALIWTDQSPNSVGTVTSGSPSLINDTLNFNPVVRFDGDSAFITTGLDINEATHSELTIHAVYTPRIDFAGGVWGEDNLNWDRFMMDFDSQPFFNSVVSNGQSGTFGIPSIFEAGTPVATSVVFDEDELNGSFVHANGKRVQTFTSNHGPESSALMQVGAIGDGDAFGYAFDGDIAEVIVYSSTPSIQEQTRIQSYLSLKYGLTWSNDFDGDAVLGESLGSFTEGDFLTSNGVVVWDYSEETGYHNDVAGIGRDDKSVLNQLKSKSQNSGAILMVDRQSQGTINNGDFLIWGNNNLTTNINDTLNLFGISILKMKRQWRLQEKSMTDGGFGIGITTELGNVNLTFDLAGLDYTSGQVSLLVDDDGNFNSGASFVMASKSFNGDLVTFENVNLDDGQFVGLCLKFLPSQSSVVNTNNSSLLYHFDANDLDGDGMSEGILESGQTANGAHNEVNTWVNKAGGSVSNLNINAGSSTGTTPDLKLDGINFNDIIEFNEFATDDYLGVQVSDFPSNEITLFSVFKSTGSSDAIFSYATATHDNEFLVDAQQSLLISAANSTGSTGVSVNNGNPTILAINRTSSTGATNLFVNAGEFGGNAMTIAAGTNLISTGTIIIGQEQDEVGGGFSSAQAFQGQMAEVMVYNSALSATDRQQVESYLAIKYGITLDQSSGTNYLASNGVVVWDYFENTSYIYDITGVGMDSGSGLHQAQSKSENNDAILTTRVVEEETLGENTFDSPITDGHFLIWANNNGSASSTSGYAINENGLDIIYNKMSRQWRFQEKNFIDAGSGVGTAADVGGFQVDYTFDLTGLPFVSNEVRLLISNDDFASASVSEVLPTFDGDLATFEDVDLSDGQYISIALSLNESPGAVSQDLVLWLKADEGTTVATGVSEWTDQSGNSNDAIQGSTGNQASLNITAINFNPALDFDGIDDHLDLPDAIFSTGDDAVAIYSVWETDIDNAIQRIISFGNVSLSDALSQQTGINGGFGGKNFGLQTETSPYDQGLLAPFESSEVYIGTTFTQDAATNDLQVALNGASFTQGTAANTARNLTTTNNHIGERFQNGSGAEYFNGRIAELVAYSDPQNATDRQKIESYLAIKYGITLDQTSGTDYLASDGTTEVWDKDASGASTHNHDIAGIGRDDFSGLIQKQSKSVNDGSILTIGLGTIAASNLTNLNEFAQNQTFLVWGSDHDFIHQTNANASDVPNNSTERMERVWRVDVTGTAETVSVSFDLTGLGYGTELSDFKLIVAESASNGVMSSGVTFSAASITNNVVTFNDITFSDGQYFTLATKSIATPGGVFVDLGLWLKANVDVFTDSGMTPATEGTTVQQWNDQSEGLSHGTETISSNKPVFRASTINFNPAIEFDGVDDRLTGISGGNMDDVFLVVIPDDVVDQNLPPQAVYSTDHAVEGYAGLFFGGTTNAFGNEVITVFGGSNGNEDWRRAQTGSASHPDNLPFIISFNNDHQTQSTFIYKNATRIDNSSANIWRPLPNKEEYRVGFGENALTGFFDGKIAEVINYKVKNNGTDRRKIESYLALKYGITLGTWIAGPGDAFNRDYYDSEGNIIWDTPFNGQYDEDIAGIGRDFSSGLEQKQSKSINSDAIVTIGLDDDLSPDGLESTNLLNDGAFSQDKSFLIWSNDGAPINPSVPNNEIDRTLTNSRLNREWQVQEVGSIGTVTIQFDVSGIAGPTGIGSNEESQIQLMVDADGDFTSGASIVFQSFEIPGDGLVNFRHDFSNGQYFTLASSELNALPIELISFEATNQPEGVRLLWETASETNNSQFKIERADRTLTFETISTLNGAGTNISANKYEYLDQNPLQGSNFYRLIDVDMNGNETRSEVIRVDFYHTAIQQSSKVYPNPVGRGEQVTIEIGGAELDGLVYSLFDAGGNPILSGSKQHYSRSDPLIIPTDNLAAGIFLLRVMTAEGRVDHFKLIVKD